LGLGVGGGGVWEVWVLLWMGGVGGGGWGYWFEWPTRYWWLWGWGGCKVHGVACVVSCTSGS